MTKVFLVEDFAPMRDMIRDILINHKVVVEASSLPEALAKVAEAIKLGCTVAIVDSSLSADSRGDGAKVALKIRAKAPWIKILAYSSEGQDWGDEFLQKPAFDKLNAVVSSLAGE